VSAHNTKFKIVQYIVTIITLVVTVVSHRYVTKLQTAALQEVVYERRKHRQEQLESIGAADPPGTHEVATVYPPVYVQSFKISSHVIHHPLEHTAISPKP
jgi:hypothetical protein